MVIFWYKKRMFYNFRQIIDLLHGDKNVILFKNRHMDVTSIRTSVHTYTYRYTYTNTYVYIHIRIHIHQCRMINSTCLTECVFPARSTVACIAINRIHTRATIYTRRADTFIDICKQRGNVSVTVGDSYSAGMSNPLGFMNTMNYLML